MITYLIKTSLALKPYHKFTYVLAIGLIVHVIYQLFFATPSAAESTNIMLNLLVLAWLALVNLMIQIFSRVPSVLPGKQSFLVRFKNILHRSLYYLLSLIFIAISIAVIILTFKILRV